MHSLSSSGKLALGTCSLHFAVRLVVISKHFFLFSETAASFAFTNSKALSMHCIFALITSPVFVECLIVSPSKKKNQYKSIPAASLFHCLWLFQLFPADFFPPQPLDLRALPTMHFSQDTSPLSNTYSNNLPAAVCSLVRNSRVQHVFPSCIKRPVEVSFCHLQRSQLDPFFFHHFFKTAAGENFHIFLFHIDACQHITSPRGHPVFSFILRLESSCRKWLVMLNPLLQVNDLCSIELNTTHTVQCFKLHLSQGGDTVNTEALTLHSAAL